MGKLSWKRISVDILFVTGALVAVAAIMAPRSCPSQISPQLAVEMAPPQENPAPRVPPQLAVVPPRPPLNKLVDVKFGSLEDEDRKANMMILQLTCDLPERHVKK